MHRFADSNYIIEEDFLRRNVMLYSLWKYKLLLILIIPIVLFNRAQAKELES